MIPFYLTPPVGYSYRVTVHVHGVQKGKRKRRLNFMHVGYLPTVQPAESLRSAILASLMGTMRPDFNPLVRVKFTMTQITDDNLMQVYPYHETNHSEVINLVEPGATAVRSL